MDIEDILDDVPMPDLTAGEYLLDILFYIGPVRGELPLSEDDFDSWERRRGIELEPWEAEQLVQLSRAYMSEMQSARSISALAPWPKAQKMWKYVMDQKHAKEQAERKDKEQEPNGNRKRHRNSAPR